MMGLGRLAGLVSLLSIFGLIINNFNLASATSNTSITGDSTNSAKLNPFMRALSEQNFEMATHLLEDMPTQTSAFRGAYTELEKALYRSKSWDRFFSFASFYRNNMAVVGWEPKLLVMEALALTKHCQVSAADQVTTLSLELVSTMKLNPGFATRPLAERADFEQFKEDILQVRRLLALQQKLPPIKTTETKTRVSLFNPNILWQISENAAPPVLQKLVKRPSEFRVYVRDICAKK